MRDDGWGRESPLPRVRPKASRSPATEYTRPRIERVALALRSDSDEFRPAACDSEGRSTFVANIPNGELRMPEMGSAVVDCGFGIEVPMGYRAMASSIVPGVVLEIVESKRFKVSVVNLRGETILRHGEPIGRLWVEPIYFFDWETRG